MNRTPPKRVREKLRKEVNFGCPVRGCGRPYLSWHHFDPPWIVQKHHNPEGMIALCIQHAALADGGRWTPEQLKKMKQSPYVSFDKISENYGYLRKKVVCLVGNVAYDTKNALKILGERVIGFERDGEEYSRLNLLIRDSNGNPILVMENNFFTVHIESLFDFRCSAQGKELEIVSKDKQTNLLMRFNDYTLDEFNAMLLERYQKCFKRFIGISNKKLCESEVKRFISDIGYLDPVPTWTIKGKLRWENIHLKIHDYYLEDLVNESFFAMNLSVGIDTALSFNNGVGLGSFKK